MRRYCGFVTILSSTHNSCVVVFERHHWLHAEVLWFCDQFCQALITAVLSSLKDTIGFMRRYCGFGIILSSIHERCTIFGTRHSLTLYSHILFYFNDYLGLQS